jgi:hypothetical protein
VLGEELAEGEDDALAIVSAVWGAQVGHSVEDEAPETPAQEGQAGRQGPARAGRARDHIETLSRPRPLARERAVG